MSHTDRLISEAEYDWSPSRDTEYLFQKNAHIGMRRQAWCWRCECNVLSAWRVGREGKVLRYEDAAEGCPECAEEGVSAPHPLHSSYQENVTPFDQDMGE